ncbi:hypothetical protein RF11_12356 [Thelohanellus kitauei]|uniref:Uncharacterized protein n=1 Tax=Thelohanellus kitauei TaxID=669202 RepID=A0A0C2J4X8_THEKT|nr:hypothetical protein RF11_12356 [Thelohanellus kitauei]
MGHPVPKFETRDIAIPTDLNLMFPMFYDIVNQYIYYYSNYTLSFYHKQRAFIDKKELFRFGFHILSIAIDPYMKLAFILDSDSSLFVICLRTNFVKLLTQNVTDFEYTYKHSSMSFTKIGQLCFYRFLSHIECSKTDLNVKKFVYYEDYQYYALQLMNHSLIIYEGSNKSLFSSLKVIFNHLLFL